LKTTLTFEISVVANQYGISTNEILQFIAEDWIQPLDSQGLIFDEDDIARLQLIMDLKNDFGVNDESVPIILHLVDQLKLIHSQQF